MDKFTPAMIDGCTAALDAKVFYQDQFADFVIARMGGYDCEPSFVAHLDLKWHGEFWPAASEQVKQHEKHLQGAPRGHYVTIAKNFCDGRVTHSFLMSDGKGYLAGQHDFYDEPVTPGHMLKRMLGYEIYCARKQLETERYVADQKKCLDGFSIGQVFRDYKHPGEIKPFAKAIVSAIYPETGNIKLVLSKRGTSTRWEAVVGAAVLRSRVETSETKDTADGLLF